MNNWRFSVWLAIFLRSTASAQPALPDPDTEIAKRHFDRGTALYFDGKYAEAVIEFEAARRAKPAPAFDYNIGRALDRLERWEEAIEAYERYAASSQDAEDGAAVRERIRALSERTRPAARPTGGTPPTRPEGSLILAPSPPSPRGAPVQKVRLLGSGIAASIVGVILLGSSVAAGVSARGYYNNLTMNCGADGLSCPNGYDGTRETGRRLEAASWILAPLCVVAAVTGVVLIIAGLRYRAEPTVQQ